MGAVVFTNIRVLDGTGKAPFAGHVRVQGNRIQEVLPVDAPLPGGPDADVVDGTGYTLMPGLTEAHAHPSFANISSLHALGEIPPEEHTLTTARNAKLMLDQGFTSLNSAASGKPRLRHRHPQRNQCRRPSRPAHSCGQSRTHHHRWAR